MDKLNQEMQIASATRDAVNSAKQQGGSIDFQSKTFTQIFSGQLLTLANGGNASAKQMYDAIWGELLGQKA